MCFNTGKMFMTKNISEETSKDKFFEKEILNVLSRYLKKDWGDLCEEDKQLNDEAIKSCTSRILAAYNTTKGKVYIITEWDRSLTTILLANEY